MSGTQNLGTIRLLPGGAANVERVAVVRLGENTAEAARQAILAQDSAEDASASAAVAEAMVGPTYASTAAGLASTANGDFFAVKASGIVTIYLNDAGTAVAQRDVVTAQALASTTPGKGASLVSLENGQTVQAAIDAFSDDGGAAEIGTESGGTLAQGLWWITLEQFGAIANTTSPAAATANKAALRAAVAWAKAKGGATLHLIAGTTYYMGTAVGDSNDSMALIDFENFNVYAGRGAKFTTSANTGVSYFFYVTRGKFRAEGVELETADSANLTASGSVGIRLFCITDDNSLGLSGFEINNCKAFGAAAHTIVFPKNGSGIRNITGRDNYVEECSYGFNSSASSSGAGSVKNVNFEITGKNVYRLAFGFGHGSDINIVARQLYGHNRTALGNGTVVNWSIPKVSGWTWTNLNIICFSDEDWARGVLLSVQTDNADVAASGANYTNRGFDGANIHVVCTRGKYSSSPSDDYALYMGHINTDTGGTVTTALAIKWQNIAANIVSPNDLTLARFPITSPTICNTTTPQKGNSLVASAELFTSSETDSLKLLSPLFDFVSVRGRIMIANAGVIKNAAGVVRTFVNYDDPHLEFGGDDTNNTRYRAGSAHTWFLSGALSYYMTGSQFSPWNDNSVTLGTSSEAWSDVQAYRVTTRPRTVAQLPAAGTAGAGARAFVTDSNVAASGNFGAVVAGSGANGVPVYSDGTNWRIG